MLISYSNALLSILHHNWNSISANSQNISRYARRWMQLSARMAQFRRSTSSRPTKFNYRSQDYVYNKDLQYGKANSRIVWWSLTTKIVPISGSTMVPPKANSKWIVHDTTSKGWAIPAQGRDWKYFVRLERILSSPLVWLERSLGVCWWWKLSQECHHSQWASIRRNMNKTIDTKLDGRIGLWNQWRLLQKRYNSAVSLDIFISDDKYKCVSIAVSEL